MYYKHYKGGLYKITARPIHTETGEELVVYQDARDPSKLWARPRSMWDSKVLHEGDWVNRFEPLTEDNCQHEMEGTYEPECKWCGKCSTK